WRSSRWPSARECETERETEMQWRRGRMAGTPERNRPIEMPELRDDWNDTLTDLEARRAAGRSMGGEERLAKHRAQGKLDARARIDALVDPGSFMELGTLTGGDEIPAEAIVLGSARVSGRPVLVAAEDFTVLSA